MESDLDKSFSKRKNAKTLKKPLKEWLASEKMEREHLKTRHNEMGLLVPASNRIKFPLQADVNGMLQGAGLLEGCTHTALYKSHSRFYVIILSSAVNILSGGPSGFCSQTSGSSFLHASEVLLPLLKNFPTNTTL